MKQDNGMLIAQPFYSTGKGVKWGPCFHFQKEEFQANDQEIELPRNSSHQRDATIP